MGSSIQAAKFQHPVSSKFQHPKNEAVREYIVTQPEGKFIIFGCKIVKLHFNEFFSERNFSFSGIIFMAI